MILHMHMSHTTTIAMAILCSVYSTLKKKVNKQMKYTVDSKKERIGMVYIKEKREARDGIGSTFHDLADCETLRNSLFTPMT